MSNHMVRTSLSCLYTQACWYMGVVGLLFVYTYMYHLLLESGGRLDYLGGGGGSHRVDKLWGATPLPPPLFLHLCCYQQLTLANSATVIVMQNYSKLLSVKKLLIALSPCFSYQYIKINVIVFIGCVRIVQFLFENIMMMIDDIIFGKCLSLVGIIFIQNTVKTRFDV